MMDTQLQMKDIDFKKIRFKEVKTLIETQMENGVSNFGDLKETYHEGRGFVRT